MITPLFSEKTFRGRPNGLRADLAQAIADLKRGFMRFPGGCLVHAGGIHRFYHWKDTIGPVEQRQARPPQLRLGLSPDDGPRLLCAVWGEF